VLLQALPVEAEPPFELRVKRRLLAMTLEPLSWGHTAQQKEEILAPLATL
jgi:hypothetical protein